MPYAPKPFVKESTPQNLADYLQEELQAISRELTETQALELRGVNVEPKKPREGMLVHADGTNWNPGNGAGLYVYQGGAWVGPLDDPIPPQDLTPYMQKANNLSDVANTTTARASLGLGTAAVLDVGTIANKIVQLDGAAKIPTLDGSQLTNLPAQVGRLVVGTPLVLNPYATSATATQAHGLGVVPIYVEWAWECLSADLNYVAGEIVRQVGYMGHLSLLADVTNLVLITSTASIGLTNKTTFAATTLTASKWKLTITPYKLT